MTEIVYTMESHGMSIDIRHIMLLADLMTCKVAPLTFFYCAHISSTCHDIEFIRNASNNAAFAISLVVFVISGRSAGHHAIWSGQVERKCFDAGFG